MHTRIFLVVPDLGKGSLKERNLQARKLALDHIGALCQHDWDDEEIYDWGVIGGRWSGELVLLRVKGLDPWRYLNFEKELEDAPKNSFSKLFQKYFPEYGVLERNCDPYTVLGEPVDAQILDEFYLSYLKEIPPSKRGDPHSGFSVYNICGKALEECLGKAWIVIGDCHI